MKRSSRRKMLKVCHSLLILTCLKMMMTLVRCNDDNRRHHVMVVTSTDEYEDPKVLEVYDFQSRTWRVISKSDVPAPLSVSYRAESLKPGTARVIEDHAILEYELKNGLSLELARYPEFVQGSSTLEYGDTLCIVGGYNSDTRSLRNDVLCWNPLNKQNKEKRINDDKISDTFNDGKNESISGLWVALPPMIVGRHQPGAVVMDGKLYVAGGYDTNTHEFLSSMEVFDDVTQRWYQMSPMKHARAGFKLLAVKGQLYAIGGWRKQNYLPVVERYNPLTDSWTELSNMISARAHFGAIIRKEEIFVVGGKNGFLKRNQLKSMEKYSIQEDRWTSTDLPDMTNISGPVTATRVLDF